MQNSLTQSLLGVLAGLAVGTLGALAYSHYGVESTMSDALAKVQAALDAANANIDKLTKDNADLKRENAALIAQSEQSNSGKEEVKTEEDVPKPAAAPAPPAFNPMAIGAMMRGAMGGGAGNPAQRLLLLKARLKLTPDQEKAVQAAMDTEQQQRRDAFRQMFRNQQGGNQGGDTAPAQPAAPVQTLDQALAGILTPAQNVEYQQVQTDEKTSQANTAATIQVNQVAPLLQLTDSQKDQVFNALYQVQMNAPSPTSLIGNPNAASTLAAQNQATTQALSQILTPDQMALYQQESQATMTFGGGGRGGGRQGRNNNPQGGGGGGGGGNAAPAPATTTPTN